MLALTSPNLPSRLYAAYRRFERLVNDGDSRLREYERAVDAEAPDIKRFLDVTGDTEPASADAPLHELRDALLNLVYANFPALDRYLLPNGPSLATLVAPRPHHLLRMTWYPAATTAVVNHPHTDIDLLTLLPSATASGLEIEMDGMWRPLSPSAAEVAVLAGEFVALFGGVAAHRHRVKATPYPRLSVSLFVNAERRLPIADRTVGDVFDERLYAVTKQIGGRAVPSA